MAEKFNLRKRVSRRYNALREEVNTKWEPQWKEIRDFIAPDAGCFYGTDSTPNDGKKTRQEIAKNTAGRSLNVFSAGLHGGTTSPARPWFKLGHQDPELAKFGPVKEWLHETRSIMLNVFSRSYVYNALHTLYNELGAFGTGALLVEEDFDHVIRCRPFTIGEYCIATNAVQYVDTLYRRFPMTVRNIVEQFGIDNVSDNVRTMYNSYQIEKWVWVIHAVEPNTGRNPEMVDNRNMPFRSVYIEEQYIDSEDSKLLRLSGYEEFPYMAPRWEVTGRNVYGKGPGSVALPDVKQLQKLEFDKLMALDKHHNPPMNADLTLREQGGVVVPGGINYVDMGQGQTGFSPAYMVNPAVQEMMLAIEESKKDIQESFYVDLFKMIANDYRSGVTATEIARKHEEKLVMLGPALERLHAELLDPLIDRTFAIMLRGGMIPPPPPELQGTELKVEYISMLAQAQKIAGIGAINDMAIFIGNMAAVKPEALDKLNVDEAIEAYADMTGVPPTMINSEEEARAIREARAMQAAQVMAAEQASQAVQGAKTLADADLDGNNALKALTGMGNAT